MAHGMFIDRPPVLHQADSQALFYSLCETALIQGVDPATYLVEAATAELRKPGTALLPQQLRK
jgi:hypothetical protein